METFIYRKQKRRKAINIVSANQAVNVCGKYFNYNERRGKQNYNMPLSVIF